MGITVNTSPQQITASVGETQIDVSVSGGFGPSGNAGAAGQAASVTVGTVTTGAAGSQASVTNVGTSSAAVLNFTIPAGATGATGPQGPAGAAGASAWSDITGKPTFAAVATSGAYSDLTGTPAAYSLPTATGSVLGGVKVGSGVSIDGSGVISVSTAYAAATHSHAIADVTGLQAALDGKAAASHSHAASAITSGTLDIARIPVVLEQTQAIGSSGSTATLSLGTGSVQTMTLSANCTVTMPAATAGASITLILTQGSAVRTCAFTGVRWPNGTAPTITATANAVDILVFVSDGTNWYGVASQKFS